MGPFYEFVDKDQVEERKDDKTNRSGCSLNEQKSPYLNGSSPSDAAPQLSNGHRGSSSSVVSRPSYLSESEEEYQDSVEVVGSPVVNGRALQYNSNLQELPNDVSIEETDKPIGLDTIIQEADGGKAQITSCNGDKTCVLPFSERICLDYTAFRGKKQNGVSFLGKMSQVDAVFDAYQRNPGAFNGANHGLYQDSLKGQKESKGSLQTQGIASRMENSGAVNVPCYPPTPPLEPPELRAWREETLDALRGLERHMSVLPSLLDMLKSSYSATEDRPGIQLSRGGDTGQDTTTAVQGQLGRRFLPPWLETRLGHLLPSNHRFFWVVIWPLLLQLLLMLGRRLCRK